MSDFDAGVPADVQADIQTVTALQVALMRATQPHRRGVHPKMHAFVEAEFEVLDDIPDELKIGLFAAPASYRAEIRFSNGGEHDDAVPDIHGIGCKLYGVPGRKALPGAPQDEHDFVLSDHPVFFAKNAADYALFMQDRAQAAAKGEEPRAFLEYLRRTDPVNAEAFIAFTQQRPVNLLGSTYWSQTPFAYGDRPRTAARFQAVPQEAIAGTPGERFDYLRERMVERLAPGRPPVIYDLEVQIHDDADEAIVENPTVDWNLPFTKVGRLTIPAQEFDTEQRRRRGEAIRLSSWNAVYEQRPIGEMNEIRRVTYLASQKERARTAEAATANLRRSAFALTRNIDDDFKRTLDGLRRAFAGVTRLTQGRASHTFGVAGRGTARIVADDDFPKTEFFTFGKIMPVTLRHATPEREKDDRAWTGVGASLKFHRHDLDPRTDDPGVLDILMDSGRRFYVRNLLHFAAMMRARSPDALRDLIAKGVIDDDAASETYRTRGSFLDSFYHGWQSFELTDADGGAHLIRYRLVPADRGPERGRPPTDFAAEGALVRPPREDDARAPDHLRRDWLHRLAMGEARYLLQTQVRPRPDDYGPDHPALDPTALWDEARRPWRDFAEITIDEPILEEERLSALDFTPNRSPPCLSLPLATSPDQFAAIGHGRAILYAEARTVRFAQNRPQAN